MFGDDDIQEVEDVEQEEKGEKKKEKSKKGKTDKGKTIVRKYLDTVKVDKYTRASLLAQYGDERKSPGEWKQELKNYLKEM